VVRIASPTFIGRSAELAQLDAALEAAAQGNPTTVLIGGDAGVGKTRLLATWNLRALERGARVIAGGCLDLGETGPAYVAVLQAFRDLLGSLDPAALDELVGSERSTLGRVIPELAEDGNTGRDDAGLTPTAQTRLFHALGRVLERAASDRPLVLELEDIHWADPSTRAFMLYFVANARAARILVIATFRAEETSREHPITPVLLELERHRRAMRVDVVPFDADELEEQLFGILGEPPSETLLAAIQARSEGNALFTEELVASNDPAVDLPSSIGAALLTRTAGLSQPAQVILRLASVVGRTASFHLLRSASALGDDQLDAALREAVEANILEAEHAGQRYRFRHALLQEAIYQDVLPGERPRMHASVAEALERDEGERSGPEHASELAYHWHQAQDHERSLAASLAAADAAVYQSAYEEALHHYERAIDEWDKARRRPLDASLAAVLERAAACAYRAGKDEKSVRCGRRALDELDRADDKAVRVRVLDQMARAVHSLTDDALDYELQLAGIDLDGLPVREQMLVLTSRVRALLWKADPSASSIAAHELLRVAEASGIAELEGDAHMTMAWNLMEARDLEGTIREALLAESLASVAGDVDTEVQAQRLVCGTHALTGKFELAITEARATRRHADLVGLSRREGPWASLFEAFALFHLGRIAESSHVIDAALLDPPTGWALRRLHALAAEVAIAKGSREAAVVHVEAARLPSATKEKEDSLGYIAVVKARLARADGRLAEVLSIVDTTAQAISASPASEDANDMVWDLVEIGLDAVACRSETARAAADEAELDAARADAKRLRGYVDAVRRRRDAAGIRDVGLNDGSDLLIAGHLARIEDRDDPALWVAAAEGFPPLSVDALTACYRQAEAMLAARIPRDEIRAVMADAHAVSVEIGAAPLAAQFAALARRARIDLRPTAPTASPEDVVSMPEEAPAPGTAALRNRGLSDREIDVLTLVSAGFSNQAIGDRLFITDKTASVHVSHILAKLGASSRTEAATIGVRLGLPDVERDDRAG
jgi:DNA-binding NarL/FixJ family response regulator